MKTSDSLFNRGAKEEDPKIRAGLEVVRQWMEERAPLEELGAAIAIAAFTGAQEIVPRLNFSSEREKHEQLFCVQFEFLYFFVHLVNRIVLNNFGIEKRKNIHDKLTPLVLNSFVEVLFSSLSPEEQRQLVGELYDYLAAAELDYASCSELIGRENPFDGKYLFSVLASKVAAQSGNDDNSIAFVEIVALAFRKYQETDLVPLVLKLGGRTPMGDDGESNGAGIARLRNGQLTERSAKLARRGLKSLDAGPESEDMQKRKLPEQVPEEIPLPEELKSLLSEIARSFIEEGRTNFDELVSEFEDLLGEELFEAVADYLPDIVQAQSAALEKERASAVAKQKRSEAAKEEVLDPDLAAAVQAFEEYQKGGKKALRRFIVKQTVKARRTTLDQDPMDAAADTQSDFVSHAEDLISDGRLQDAVSLLRKAISEMPSNWKPFNESADEYEVFFWSEEDFLSFAEYNKSKSNKMTVWTYPSYSKAHYLLAHTLSECGDHLGALQVIDQGLDLEPDQPVLLCEKAFVLGHLNYREESLTFYQKAADARPWISASDTAQALRGQGFSLIELNRVAESEAAFRESLEYEPDNENARRELEYAAGRDMRKTH